MMGVEVWKARLLHRGPKKSKAKGVAVVWKRLSKVEWPHSHIGWFRDCFYSRCLLGCGHQLGWADRCLERPAAGAFVRGLWPRRSEIHFYCCTWWDQTQMGLPKGASTIFNFVTRSYPSPISGLTEFKSICVKFHCKISKIQINHKTIVIFIFWEIMVLN